MAEEASHQDIIDLLKAHAEASSIADLLWAGLSTFTYGNPELSIVQHFCFSSGEEQNNPGHTYVFHNVAVFFFFHVFANMPCLRESIDMLH